MVFVNTKREADRVQAYLQANDIDASAISGDVPQKKRLNMLMRFQSGELPVLIGTDVASRGLHIPDVQYVINYDLPQDREDYVHRIGRTARAGASGDAISFGCETYAIGQPPATPARQSARGQTPSVRLNQVPDALDPDEVLVLPRRPTCIRTRNVQQHIDAEVAGTL
jgi:superfamily II DNA/RNA helicase